MAAYTPGSCDISAAGAFLGSAMSDSTRQNRITAALWTNALFLGAILLTLVLRHPSPGFLPMALGDDGRSTNLYPPPIAGGGGVFLMPAQFSDHVWGCYLMDIDKQTLVAYSCSGSPPQLRLTAARNFSYDLRLKNYNTEKPWPDEVKKLWQKQQEMERAATTMPAPAPAESPAEHP